MRTSLIVLAIGCFTVPLLQLACSSEDATGAPDAGAADAPTRDRTQPLDAGAADAPPAIDANMPVTVDCATYCAAMAHNCTDALKQFPSTAVCVAECEAFPAGQLEDTAGTLGCRLRHAKRANALPHEECYAAGPSGNGACGSRCEAFCQLAYQICVSNYSGAPPFLSISDCQNRCESYRYDLLAPEYDPTPHDTLNCRQNELQQAFAGAIEAGTVGLHCLALGADSGACHGN